MDAKSQLKFDIIFSLNKKEISLADAMSALDVSKRTVERYLQQFKADGVAFVFHGNRGKVPHNRLSDDVRKKIISIMKTKYFDFNMTHAIEKFASDEGVQINRESFRKICHDIKMVKRAKRRRAKVHKVRERIAQEGILLQMDGSPERWFGGKESCLISAIDDATSEVYYGEFFGSETTLGCMKVIKRIIEKKGLFKFLYVDRAGIFGGPKRVHFSQVKRALQELGIRIIFANSPQAKGRIERLWNTLQDRIIPEMRLRRINNFETANYYLQEEFLPNVYNKKFKVIPRNLEPAWQKVPTNIDLNQIFCMKEPRTVKNDHTYSYNGQIYKITSQLKYSIKKQQIEIRTYLDGTSKVFFADKEIIVERFHIQPRFTIAEKVDRILDDKNTFKVRKDSHIEYNKQFYSVDPKYIGKSITVKEQEGVVLLFNNNSLVETHSKPSRFVKASTKPNHLGPWQAALLQSSVYRKAAKDIGVNCDRVVFTLLQRGQGVIDNKSIWAIMDLQKEYAKLAIDEACKLAMETDDVGYRAVASILRLRYTKRVSNG